MALVNLVRVASATTGTGTLTLGSPVVGFLDMASAGAVNGTTYSYVIEGSYVAAGDELVASAREVGRGVWSSSANTLTRSVISSTNSNALLNLTGDEQVIIGVAAEDIRERLRADTTIYVRAGGSDSAARTGLNNADADAFQTFNYAIQRAFAYDMAGYNVTVMAGQASQAWTAAVLIDDNSVNVGPRNGTLILDFNGGTLTVTNDNCISTRTIIPIDLVIQNVTLSTITSGDCIVGGQFGEITLGTGVTFGACAGYHVEMTDYVVYVCTNNYTISGGAVAHLATSMPFGWIFNFPTTVTISGTPNFSVAFAYASYGQIWGYGTTFSGGGGVTGYRMWIDQGGTIQTSSLTHFPGSLGNNFVDSFIDLGDGHASLIHSSSVWASRGSAALSPRWLYMIDRATMAFSDGTKWNLVGTREVVNANRTYYFRSDGTDDITTRDGLTNSAGGAFRTLQYLYDNVILNLDFAGHSVIAQNGDAFSSTAAFAAGSSWVGGGYFFIDNNNASWTVTNNACITVLPGVVLSGPIIFRNVTLSTVTSGNCIYHAGNGAVNLGSGVTFGACAGYHAYANGPGALINLTNNNYTISGNANTHAVADGAGSIIWISNETVTVSGTRTFSQFVWALRLGVIYGGATYNVTGTVTGSRYTGQTNAIIETFGAGASYFPGNSAGSTSTGAVYE